MAQIVNADVPETGPLPDAVPVRGEVRQAAARLAPGDHPGIARNTGNPRQHRRRRRRNHARARLGLPQPQLSRRAVHIVPPQGQKSR